MVEKLVISNTQVAMISRCSRQWEFRYVKGLKVPPAGVMIEGSAYHGAVAENFKSQMDKGTQLSEPEFEDAFSTYWDKSVKQGIKDDEETLDSYEIDWGGEFPGKLKDEGIRIAKLYKREVAPRIVPVKIEQNYEKQIDENTKFIGFLDVETNDKIIDHKLKAKTINQMDADKEIQPLSYCFLTGKMNFDYHVATKTKIPKIDIVSVTKTQKDIDWWEEALKQVVAQMRSGVYPPNQSGWWCGKRFCGYWQKCHNR